MDEFNFLVWKKNNFLKTCFKIFKNQLLDILFKDIKGELQKGDGTFCFTPYSTILYIVIVQFIIYTIVTVLLLLNEDAYRIY